MKERLCFGILAAGLLGALGWAVWSLPAAPAGLTAMADEHLAESGVDHPVTAVLLNFRGYDTLLEISVLLLAMVGVWALRPGQWPAGEVWGRPLLFSLLRLLLPILILFAGYLLWVGAFAPGGAFQAGALLGGALVLSMLGGLARRELHRVGWLRVWLVAGVVIFAGAGVASVGLTGGMLEYPAGSGGTWILVIETAATVSIGLTLGLLYLGGRPDRGSAGGSTSHRSGEHG